MDRGFQQDIADSVDALGDIVFVTYSVLDETEERIKFALHRMLEKHGKEEYFTPLYSCTKELIANATKANAKQILIEEGIIRDPDDPIDVVKQIRSILNERALLEYGIKTKLRRFSTRTYFRVRDGVLTIEVINNLPLAEKDIQRILDRIEKSSHYDSIAEFYMENPDPIAEGMGLGLSMVVVLLKSININYRNFTVFTDGERKTYAKVNIPLV